jgi:predicted secreted protein
MKLGSAIAVYFIIWWAVLFVVLPFGIRNAHEAGEAVEAGNEPGAPISPRLGLKALITTGVATVIFAAFYWAKAGGLLAF